MGLYGLLVSSAALGGDDDLVADSVKGSAQFLFTVGISIGGIKIIDAGFIGSANQLHSVRMADTLNRQGAERRLGDIQLRASQSDLIHGSPPAPCRVAAALFSLILPQLPPFAKQSPP